ncbi:hypothetical protein [Flavobacterium sp. FlaQc-48]
MILKIGKWEMLYEKKLDIIKLHAPDIQSRIIKSDRYKLIIIN